MSYTKIFCVLFILIFSTGSFSQEINSSKKLDSLFLVLNGRMNDTTRVNIYQSICQYYLERDRNKMIYYNIKILNLAKKSNYKKGLGYYYLNLSNTANEIENVTKAKKIFYDIKDWENYFKTCCELSEWLTIEEKNDEAKKLLEKNLKLALLKKNKQIPRLYFSLGQIYTFESDYAKALVLLKKALSYKLTDDLKFRIYDNLAFLHSCIGTYTKALEYSNLSFLYARTEYFKAIATNTRISILYESRNFDEFFSFVSKSKNTTQETKCMIAKMYYFLGNHELAKKYIDTVLRRPIKRDVFRIYIYTVKADISLALHNIQEAENYINKGLSLLTSLNGDYHFELPIQVYDTKARIEEGLKNYKTALIYHKKVNEIKDINQNNNNKNQLNSLQIELGLSEKENRIKQLQLQEKNKQAEIATKNTYLVYLISALIVAIFSVIFYVRNARIIKRKNMIIKREKELVQKSLHEKEILLKEIHHRVKNNLQLVMSLLYVQSRVKKINITDFIEISQSRILAMSLIHENLYQTDNLSKVNLKEYVDNLLQSISASYSSLQKDIQLKIEVEENIQFDIQTAIPLGLIINELVNNSYKHAFTTVSSGVISLQLKKKYNFFKLVIKDNGTGKLEKGNNIQTLGLELVNQLVSQLNGVIEVKNNGGLQYQIQFRNITTL